MRRGFKTRPCLVMIEMIERLRLACILANNNKGWLVFWLVAGGIVFWAIWSVEPEGVVGGLGGVGIWSGFSILLGESLPKRLDLFCGIFLTLVGVAGILASFIFYPMQGPVGIIAPVIMGIAVIVPIVIWLIAVMDQANSV